ncbi:MAG: PKD domain-containing protein, partial [Chthoniobacteraceae bacterium]
MKNRQYAIAIVFIAAVLATWWFSKSAGTRSDERTTAGDPESVQARTAAAAPTQAPVAPAAKASMAAQISATGDVLSDFTAWTQRYFATAPEKRSELEPEGVKFAATRRPAFQKLIQTDPKRALELAVPRVVRQDLPASVTALLEKPVSAKGDFNVYLGRPAPGVPVPDEGLVLRYFEAEGVSYKAHVFGELTSVMSKKGVPLQGVSLERDFAVAENAVRQLEIGERIAAGTVVEQTCPVSGETTKAVATGEAVTADAPTVEIAGRIITLCNGSHVRVLEDEFRTYVQASGPGGGGFFMDNFPGTSSRAIGNFRCLYVRVTYPDQMAQPITEERAYADMRDNARYYLEGSYGKMTQTTTVTSLVVLPHTLAWYKAKDADVDGLGLIHTDSRNAARALGYDPSQYDCIIVRINKGPRLEGISWGGGSSVWVTWDGMDVLNHECGHSLGRNHANSWDSLDGTPYGYGQNGEYGNPFDVMGGSGGFSAHYNTISKRALGWLPDGNIHLVKGNGVYRIYAYDQPTLEEGKRYALNVAKDSVRQYNLEYHPARGGYLVDNALVLYSGMGSNAGHLLDTTQGSPAGKDDGGIAIGRTYSDWEADMHFTVLGKNATTPPSLDIAFNRGPFPGNAAPTATLAASATTIAAGGSVTFTATANDADGDALAYQWEFDDGVAGTNSAVFTRTFSTVAQITAMLTVSDMKGGTVRRSVVINVGSHGKQTITGTVTAGGQPLQGVYITGGGKACYSDVDGTYSLAGVSTGSQTLTAALTGYTFTPSFSNPITVVAGTNTADWTAAGSTFVALTKVADAAEGGANGVFRFTRTGSTAADLVVLVSPAGGTAVKGTDYTFTPDYTTSGSFRAFTIPAGSATLDVSVAAVNTSGVQDTTAEGPETITLQLAGATGYLSNSANAVVMTIADNDTALPQVSVTAPDPYATEAPAGDTATFTFSRIGSTASSLNLAVAWSGTATNGTDYTTLPTTVTIPAGQSSINVTVTPIDDALIETPETVSAT